jgi:UDP-2-acetamido-3-amino-2,3-dideoxy-glucuronate N-acetyltransferase
MSSKNYFVHESSLVDEGAQIGEGTKIWHFSHVMKDAKIGEKCILGQNVFVASGVVIGNNVKIQNNVSLYTGAEIEDDVFLGPSCVLTNITNPRSQIVRHSLYEKTVIRRGATIGANAVVSQDVPDYALMVGVPAKQTGWMSRHGIRLPEPDSEGVMVCAEGGYRYKQVEPGVLKCLDLDEEAPLPADKAAAKGSYKEFKRK